jgi:hypothetical protein
MIKFTNAAEQFRGNPIYINPEWVVAVFEVQSQDGGSLKTVIYGGPTGNSWEVEEGLADTIKLISNK